MERKWKIAAGLAIILTGTAFALSFHLDYARKESGRPVWVFDGVPPADPQPP